MKKVSFLIFTVIVMTTAICQEKSVTLINKSTTNDSRIENKVVDTIYSHILGEERPIWVYVPKHLDTSKKFPVLYILDGNAHFNNIISLIEYLNNFHQIPEMVIVAIPNTNRMLDLTPSRMEISRDGDSIPKGVNGGGDNFTSFMEQELIPYIDKKYPTTSHKTLVGHSLGGLMAINMLIHHPDIFNSYIAIDPSLWWNNQKLLKESKEVLKQEKFTNKSLYIAVANTMRDGMQFNSVERDTTDASLHMRSILDFTKSASKNIENELQFDWKYYANENHGSIPLVAEYDGLKSVFSWFYLNINDEFRKPIASPEYLIDFIEKHYEKTSKYFGYKVLPDEDFINQLGYRFLSTDTETKAKSYAFFNLNIKNHPESANVYDSMADYYEKQNDLHNAFKSITKAYEISGSDTHKRRMEKLKKYLN